MKRRLAFVQLAMVSMALHPADTAASESPKKVRRVTKKELRYLLKRLREADMSIFVAFVKQQVDESEGVELAHYPERQVLWNKWSVSDKLCLTDLSVTWLLQDAFLAFVVQQLACPFSAGERG